jgi:superfamily II DNA/RNA helicase
VVPNLIPGESSQTNSTDRSTNHRTMSRDSSSDDDSVESDHGVDCEEQNDRARVADDATFKTMGVSPALCLAIEAIGWKAPTEIQIGAIPECLKGRDIIGLAGMTKNI